MEKRDLELLYTDNNGVYIPQLFAEDFTEYLDDEQKDILSAGPTIENEEYWNVWNEVLDNVTIKSDNGHKYNLFQEGDLFAIPVEWNEKDWIERFGNL